MEWHDIGNIHVMRGSYNDVEKVAISDGSYDLTWNTSIAKTQWLDHVAKVLMSTLRCCYQMVRNKRNVLVHCSDGWDRTAQVCSLVQMLLDPYFRTIDGFQTVRFLKKLKNVVDCVHCTSCNYRENYFY